MDEKTHAEQAEVKVRAEREAQYVEVLATARRDVRKCEVAERIAMDRTIEARQAYAAKQIGGFEDWDASTPFEAWWHTGGLCKGDEGGE